MANERVAVLPPDTVTQPSYIYTECEPFERIVCRLNGLSALSVVAQCAMDSDGGPPCKSTWESLWHYVSLASQDIKRDLVEMRGTDHA